MKKYTDFVIDREGNAVVGAEVYVRLQADDTLVTLYSDNGVTGTANPTVTDNNGKFEFYTADATLKLEVYVDGAEENEVSQIQHYDDLDNEVAALRTCGTSAADKLFYFTGAGTGSITDLPAFGRTLIANASAADARADLEIGSSALLAEATAAEFRNNTADKVLTTDIVWSAAAGVALAESGGNVAVDLNSGINFTLAMTGNWALSNPTNGKAFQQGVVQITQDATGSRTLSFGANWLFAGGIDPVLSTAANAIDLLYFEVLSGGTTVYANLVKGIA